MKEVDGKVHFWAGTQWNLYPSQAEGKKHIAEGQPRPVAGQNWDEAPEGYPLWIESKMPGARHGWHADELDRYVDPTGSYWLKGREGTDYIVHRPPQLAGVSTPDWSKAPDGHPLWIECYQDPEDSGWHREAEDRYWGVKGFYRLKKFEGEEFVVHRPPQPTWDGTGRPPAGIECEWLQSSIPVTRYVRVKVIGHDGGLVVFRIAEGSNKGEYEAGSHGTVPTVGPIFRPLLTVEQMAAKQREEKISRIMADAGIWGSAFKDDPEARVWAASLVDKGYEPPEEQGK
ncbi:MAG: hypothetical protein KKC02_02160 [Gammaproteobacteria bacterium]|nr:hypothetical protein [Gammaproteobacteria bacterium]